MSLNLPHDALKCQRSSGQDCKEVVVYTILFLFNV